MTKWIVLLSVCAAGAGCSSNIETRVSSNGVPSPAPEAFMISTVAETSSDLHVAHKLVAATMEKHGFPIAKSAPLHVEITLDSRPAALSLGTRDGAEKLSPAKKKKMLQSCEDREYRLGVTFTRVADATEIYRGRAAEYHCKLPLADALPTLVNAALADFGRPRGSYAVLRNGRD